MHSTAGSSSFSAAHPLSQSIPIYGGVFTQELRSLEEHIQDQYFLVAWSSLCVPLLPATKQGVTPASRASWSFLGLRETTGPVGLT